MSLGDDVDLEEFVMAKDDLSGADIKAVCTEAGLLALRERRMRVNKADFTAAREKVGSSRKFVVSVSLLFAGAIQKERGHSRGTLLVDIWSCLSWGLQTVISPHIYILPGLREHIRLSCEMKLESYSSSTLASRHLTPTGTDVADSVHSDCVS